MSSLFSTLESAIVLAATALASAPYDPTIAKRMVAYSDAAYCGDVDHGGVDPITNWTCPPCTLLSADFSLSSLLSNTTRQTFGFTAMDTPAHTSARNATQRSAAQRSAEHATHVRAQVCWRRQCARRTGAFVPRVCPPNQRSCGRVDGHVDTCVIWHVRRYVMDVHGRARGRVHGRMYGHVHGHVHERVHGHVHGHVYGIVHGHVDKHVYRHGCGHLCGHVYRHVRRSVLPINFVDDDDTRQQRWWEWAAVD